MAIDKSLISGNTDMLILKLLEKQDMYGYQMIEELAKQSDHTFELKAGTLYPLLHLLEQEQSQSRRDCSRQRYKAGMEQDSGHGTCIGD